MEWVRHCVAFLLLAVISACNLPLVATAPASPESDTLATIVAITMQSLRPSTTPTTMLTLAATRTQTPTLSTTYTPVPTSSPVGAQVLGKVCYPTGIATDLTAYFQNTSTNQAVELAIGSGKTQYSLELPPATYFAYAWVTDYSIGGSYSACGATPGCNNAVPKPFTVTAGKTVTGIDLCDWTHGPFDVPYPPGFQPTAKLGILAGSISGHPYGSLPQLIIVAFSQDTPYWYWVGTVAGQAYYTITDLPPGNYLVAAYDTDGHAGGCPNLMKVIAGQTATADISDWSGSYPVNPLK